MGKQQQSELSSPDGEWEARALNRSAWATLTLALRRLAHFAATPHEVIRTLRSPNVARGFPRYTSWLRRLALGEALLLAVIAIVQPWLLAPILAFTVLGVVWFRWQARPTRGRDRGWPEGSVGVGSQAMSDPDFYFKGWSKYGRVFKANLFDKPIVCVVGVREAMELFHQHGDSLVPAAVAPWNRFIPGRKPRCSSSARLCDRMSSRPTFPCHLMKAHRRAT